MDICSLRLKSHRLTFPYYASFVRLFPACPALECRSVCTPPTLHLAHARAHSDKKRERVREREREREREEGREFTHTCSQTVQIKLTHSQAPGAACQPTNEGDLATMIKSPLRPSCSPRPEFFSSLIERSLALLSEGSSDVS